MHFDADNYLLKNILMRLSQYDIINAFSYINAFSRNVGILKEWRYVDSSYTGHSRRVIWNFQKSENFEKSEMFEISKNLKFLKFLKIWNFEISEIFEILKRAHSIHFMSWWLKLQAHHILSSTNPPSLKVSLHWEFLACDWWLSLGNADCLLVYCLSWSIGSRNILPQSPLTG